MSKPTSVKDILDQAAKTFEERNATYGYAYKQHGAIMAALFPNGITLTTQEDFTRFGLINMIAGKLNRHCQGWPEIHLDNPHDLGVYAFMLQEIEMLIKEKK